MTIEQYTNKPNHYEVMNRITDAAPVAEFDVVENRITGETEIVWKYGMDDVPLEILSEARTLMYMEE